MAASHGSIRAWSVHPVHAAGLFGAFALFLGALLTDLAYWHTYQVQWTNFSSWLAGAGLVFATLALACSLWAPLAKAPRDLRAWLYPAVLAMAWLLGLWNVLVHTRDAWGSMPGGLVLSALVLVVHGLASSLAYLRARTGGSP